MHVVPECCEVAVMTLRTNHSLGVTPPFVESFEVTAARYQLVTQHLSNTLTRICPEMLGKLQTEQSNNLPQIPYDSAVFGTTRQPTEPRNLRQGVAGSNPVSPTMCPGFLTKSGVGGRDKLPIGGHGIAR